MYYRFITLSQPLPPVRQMYMYNIVTPSAHVIHVYNNVPYPLSPVILLYNRQPRPLSPLIQMYYKLPHTLPLYLIWCPRTVCLG